MAKSQSQENADKMKAIMKSGKSTTYKFTYTPKMKKVTKSKGVLAQRRLEIDVLAVKAREVNADAAQMVANLETENYDVENKDLITITKQRIEEIAHKEKPTAKDLERLKEYASVRMYDVGIKAKLKVPGKTQNGIQLQKEEYVPLGELRLAIGRQARFALDYETGKESPLSDKDVAIVSQYAQTLINENQTYTPSTDYLKQIANAGYKNKDWRVKNVQINNVKIGGYSALLNDLSYTYGAYRLGTEFVTMLQGIMANPVNFDLIEGWYRSSEGKHVKQLINDSVKKFWYKGFLSFSVAIIEAINSMPNLDKKSQQKLADIQQTAEIIADEEMQG